MSDLTPRQTEILRLIQRCIAETGMPPTRAEIAKELGFRSANAAEEHLRALARKGVIALMPGDRKSTRLNSSHSSISYAVFRLKKKNKLVLETHDGRGDAHGALVERALERVAGNGVIRRGHLLAKAPQLATAVGARAVIQDRRL